MNESMATIEQQLGPGSDPGPAASGRKARKPSSEWKKTARRRTVKEMTPLFVGKFELATHLCCDVSTINQWVYEGRIPPPHSHPGERHPVWLREYFLHYVKTGAWPAESWPNRRPPRRVNTAPSPEP